MHATDRDCNVFVPDKTLFFHCVCGEDSCDIENLPTYSSRKLLPHFGGPTHRLISLGDSRPSADSRPAPQAQARSIELLPVARRLAKDFEAMITSSHAWFMRWLSCSSVGSPEITRPQRDFKSGSYAVTAEDTLNDWRAQKIA
jgi:hypothetical protein